ncbi:MAG: hypothetical protein DRJ96_00045 [Thermoprotei archaeon]|nr:MAG: hypothetical protein DRJ67_05015 [Thermoprotei archaeon]RLE98763.1 MAG: hypothetical protein DRJ96_00045 [Thermoprotei archaeon]
MYPVLDLRTRLKIAWHLREHGFSVRMHSFEYLVGDGKRFVAIILVDPSGRAEVIKLSPEAQLVAELVRTAAPKAEVRIVE